VVAFPPAEILLVTAAARERPQGRHPQVPGWKAAVPLPPSPPAGVLFLKQPPLPIILNFMSERVTLLLHHSTQVLLGFSLSQIYFISNQYRKRDSRITWFYGQLEKIPEQQQEWRLNQKI
jgi:hypothetical protein